MKRLSIFLFVELCFSVLRAQIPIWNYQLGMKFYYPQDTAGKRTGEIIPGYSKDESAYYQNFPEFFVTYENLAGKTYELTDTFNTTRRNSDDNMDSILIITLINRKAPDTIYFAFPYDAIKKSREEWGKKRNQTFSLTEAICEDDVMDCKRKYLDSSFYSNFPVKTDTLNKVPLKYQLITITKVCEGTWDAPVRIYFKFGTVDNQYIDVITTGTNVPPAFMDNPHFLFSFLTTNPYSKFNVSHPHNYWDSICAGQVLPGMDSAEVILSIGEPIDKDSDVDDKKTTITWTYKNGTVIFVKDKVQEIKLK